MPHTRNILVTSALPYANGSIHIGHLVEYIQTDIWVRFQRLAGNTVTYVCGDDAHGTPIMLKAREAGVSPEDWIAKFHAEHKADFATFGIGFDNYYTTHSELNQELCNFIYERVQKSGLVIRKVVEQQYDPVANMFLPDRFIKGTCPNCKSPGQFGDSCEVCDKTFDPTDLIDPVSVISGATPVMKESEHLFIQLEPQRQFLRDLYEKSLVDDAVKNKLLDWFYKEETVEEQKDGQTVKVKRKVEAPLRDWDITRDAPFFGFPIPGETNKFFYNWFDAPIGYLASLGNKIGERAAGTEEYWNSPDIERWHFIGKDIQYFHALFWPVMLNAAGFKTPSKIAIHGHLTVAGKKMSKRDGTFIKGSTFAKYLDPQYLRYYYATKLGPTPEDLDLSFEDLSARVNGELVNKLANLVSRCAPMLTRLLDGKLGVSAMDAIPLLKEIRGSADAVAEAYDSRNFAAATRLIATLADKANKYVEDQAPWKLVKTDAEGARGVLTAALEAGRILTIYLKPVLPDYAAKVEQCLAIQPLEWKHIQDAMEPHIINPFEHLVQRLDTKAVEAMIEESKDKQTPPQTPSQTAASAVNQIAKGVAEVGGALANVAAAAVTGAIASATAAAGAKPAPGGGAGHPDDEPLAPIIDITAFAAVDLRVARVISAEPVDKSDKLMRLSLDVGALGTRTILAGIKKAYTPDRLNGRLLIFCANLAPRTMGKFGTSEGMVCAAGPGGTDVFVLSPDSGAKPGQRIH